MIYEYIIVDFLPKSHSNNHFTTPKDGKIVFKDIVNDYCKDGWEPIGDVSYVDRGDLNQPVGPVVYLQAMKRLLN